MQSLLGMMRKISAEPDNTARPEKPASEQDSQKQDSQEQDSQEQDSQEQDSHGAISWVKRLVGF